MKTILENIRTIRAIKGLSQEFMATKIGLSQSSYALIENGKRSLKYDDLFKIAIIFEMDICDVIRYPNNKESKLSHFTEKVFIQIEVEKEAREQVLNIIYGQNNL
ncbi:MAG TPA: helix-turn-helix transcriptional regulator [Bacteroidales bacterium]|nr:helix-turn-helix transcriptional regulator [Bacteroidales bacterium]HQB20466.1 helix-turn-helix transcriptional regulator [Bacteroidales bacterium]